MTEITHMYINQKIIDDVIYEHIYVLCTFYNCLNSMFRIVSILIYFNTHAFKKSQYFHGIYSMVDFADFYNNSTDFNVKKISYRF